MKKTKATKPTKVIAVPFDPNQLRAELPDNMVPVQNISTRKENIPCINVNESVLPCINAEVKSFNETPFFVPVKNSEHNLITNSDEPYLGVVKDTMEHYIKQYDGGERNIGERIVNICEDHYTNAMISNMNIIFSDGLLNLLFKYAMIDRTAIMNVYNKLIRDNFITGYYGAKNIFRKLIFKDGYSQIREYHQNRDEMVDIMSGCNEVRICTIKLISSVIYQFLNTVVFNGYINTTKLNKDILGELNTVTADIETEIPIEDIRASAPSLALQYLLEIANIDINKIAEISDVIYITVINQMLREIYLVQNYATIQPLISCKNKYEDDDYSM